MIYTKLIFSKTIFIRTEISLVHSISLNMVIKLFLFFLLYSKKRGQNVKLVEKIYDICEK